LHWAQGGDSGLPQPAFTSSGYENQNTAANTKVRPEAPTIINAADRSIAHDGLFIIIITGLTFSNLRQIHFTAFIGVGYAHAFQSRRIGQEPVRPLRANHWLLWGYQFDFSVKKI
jgi:hypothetical protein